MQNRSLLRAGRRVACACAIAVLAVSGCSSDIPGTSARTQAGSVGPVDLKAAGCPDTIGIQTDWTPQGEHAYAYQLLGPGYTFDTVAKSVTGPLYSRNEYTGVDVKIVAGGPAIGFQSAASQLVVDPDLLLAHTSTDDAVALSPDIKVTAVFAQLDKSPSIILWDPATYPEVKTLNDLGKTGARVLYFDGLMYMDYLVQKGVFTPGQLDPSYDGTPSAFVADQGRAAQHGFAGSEPYVFEHEVAAWSRPVAFDLVHNYGYQPYMSAVSILTDRIEQNRSCLNALVPVLQQALVDVFTDPSRAATIILEAGETYGTGVAYSQGLVDYSLNTQRQLELASNGTNDYVGDFDAQRFAENFAFVSQLLEEKGVSLPAGLSADGMYTNEFIDTSIGF